MKRLNGAGTRALAAARQFTVAQRTIALIGVAVLVLGGIALANWMAKPTYAPLFTNLSGADASAIVAQLDKDKVDHQYGDGGSTILVPAGQVDAERVAAAAAGLPSGGASGGYSLLDKMGVTASEFQQNVTYKRAIEGELAKTIGSIDGVTGATVQLAIPQQSVFTDEKQDPTASVFVDASTPLTSDQVGAIVHLVAAAYPGLTDANVSVVDQKGDTLSAVGGAAAGSAAQKAGDYETRTRQAVQSMLDKVLGPGNATVTVAADVSASTGTTRSETYTTPTGAPVLSESNNDQSYSGSGANGAAATGVLGTDTTNGTGAASTGSKSASGGDAGNTFSQKQGVKNNAVNKTTTEQSITPGTLNRQTIAVAVNATVAGTISTSALTQMVSNAAGVQQSRGDTVSVTSVAFSNAAQKAAAQALQQSKSAQSADQMSGIIQTAIKVVGGLVLFVLVVVLLGRLFRRQDPTVRDLGTMNIVPPGEPVIVGNMSAVPIDATAPTAVLRGGPFIGGALPPAEDEFAQLQADVDALAGADPEQTAGYLRALMGERAGA